MDVAAPAIRTMKMSLRSLSHRKRADLVLWTQEAAARAPANLFYAATEGDCRTRFFMLSGLCDCSRKRSGQRAAGRSHQAWSREAGLRFVAHAAPLVASMPDARYAGKNVNQHHRWWSRRPR